MPLANKNYVTPAWIDNAAPPINDDELNAMSETVEGSQMLVGNGAPTSSTQGKVGQRYADISTTPPTMYQVKSQSFPGQPIPKMQTKSELTTDGYLVAYYGENREEIRVGSDNSHQVTVVTYERIIGYVAIVFACMSPGAQAYITYPELTTGGGVTSVSLTLYNEDSGLYYWSTRIPASNPHDNQAPWYFTLQEALAALKNQPATWEQVQDPNRNLAQEYSTGSSYAAGDCCIYGGWLYKALEATSGAWDGSKWERARYADELSGHVADDENPHHVTAAQTGAASPSVLATVQATTTAVRDYYAGDYFIYEGQLYEVKEAVQQGEDLLGEGKPDDVSVYNLDTWYPAAEYRTAYKGAGIVNRGFDMQITRNIGSNAKYCYAWFPYEGGGSARVTYLAVFSKYKDDLIFGRTPADPVEPYNQTAATYGQIFYAASSSSEPEIAGEYYFRVWSQERQSHPVRPINARVFQGTKEQFRLFLEGLSDYKKSELSVLGDGVSNLYPKQGNVTLYRSWSGTGPYQQWVTVTGLSITERSKIDLCPTAAQLEQLSADGVHSLMIENLDYDSEAPNRVMAWAIGAVPSVAMTLKCIVRETV